MKILFIFTFYLISGPVRCFDVTGYSGGSVFIFPEIKWNSNPYICKTTQNHCTFIKSNSTIWFYAGRILLYLNIKDHLVVFMRDLEPQDAGTYRFGVEGQPSKDVDLKVKNDACCGATQRVTGYLGENITIDCHYPQEFKNNSKSLYKMTYINFKEIVYTSETEARKERFSLVNDREANVFRVKFSNLTEDDAGLYLCCIYRTYTGSYQFTVKTIQLQVTERPPYITPHLSSSITSKQSSSSVIIVTVCVCLTVLLMTGGVTLMFYRLKYKKKDGVRSERPDTSDTKHIPMDPLYENIEPKTMQQDSVYE